MRTTVGSSRRVGVCAARNRATAVSTSAASSEPSGHCCDWRTPASSDLVPVELGVLGEQRVPERGDELGARAAARRKPYASLPASSTMPCTSKQCASASRLPVVACGRRAAGTLRNRSRLMRSAACTAPRRSSVVGRRCSAWCSPFAAVNAWCTVSQSPWSFCTWKRAMRSAAAYATARPICSSSAPARERVEQRGRDDLGIVVEQLPTERADVGELAAARAAVGERVVERLDRAPGERGVVVRVAPLAELLRARGGRGLAHERRAGSRRPRPCRGGRPLRTPCS